MWGLQFVARLPASHIMIQSFFCRSLSREISPVSLHDALPILAFARIAGETAPLLFTALGNRFWSSGWSQPTAKAIAKRDRQSTRLNSSHRCISYSVFSFKIKNPLHEGIPGATTPGGRDHHVLH